MGLQSQLWFLSEDTEQNRSKAKAQAQGTDSFPGSLQAAQSPLEPSNSSNICERIFNRGCSLRTPGPGLLWKPVTQITLSQTQGKAAASTPVRAHREGMDLGGLSLPPVVPEGPT